MDWRRGRSSAVVALVGAIVVFALGAAPASAAPLTLRSSTTIPPDPSFTITPSAPYVTGQSLTFTANQTVDPNGGTLSYAWTVDSNSTPVSTASSYSQTFTSGPHTITLTVTDSEGDPAQASSQTITVTQAQQPQATFTAPSGAEGVAINFDGSGSSDPNSGGTITSYAWDFGDGSTATTSGPTTSHTYAQPGSYTATLTVTDNYGQTSAAATQMVVVADAAAVAAFAVFPTTPSVGTVIAFNGTRTGDPDDATATYAWRFGDGTQASGASVTHVYEEAGTYTVVLTVTDSDGQASATQRVHVAPLASTSSPPTARFTAPQGRQGTPVAFDGSGSRDPNQGGTLGYRWTFGDGGVGAGIHTSHAFRAGTWTVTLTVTDNASGLSNSVSHAVTIRAAVCVVPALRGKLLPTARRALQAAHCSLAHTTTPKRPARPPGKHTRWQLVVASQSPRAGRVRAKGAAVHVTLVWRAIAT